MSEVSNSSLVGSFQPCAPAKVSMEGSSTGVRTCRIKTERNVFRGRRDLVVTEIRLGGREYGRGGIRVVLRPGTCGGKGNKLRIGNIQETQEEQEGKKGERMGEGAEKRARGEGGGGRAMCWGAFLESFSFGSKGAEIGALRSKNDGRKVIRPKRGCYTITRFGKWNEGNGAQGDSIKKIKLNNDPQNNWQKEKKTWGKECRQNESALIQSRGDTIITNGLAGTVSMRRSRH